MTQFNMVPAGNISVVSVATIKAADLQPVKAYKDNKRTDEDVLVNGKKVYRVNGVSFLQDDDVVDFVSLRVFQPVDVIGLKKYALVNPVFTPYVRDNRIAWSVTADSLVEVK